MTNVCRKSWNKIGGLELCSESVEVRVREGWLDSNRMGRVRHYVRMSRFFHFVVLIVMGFVVRRYRVKGTDIIKVSAKLGNCLLSSQPHRHLPNILFLITCLISLLCIVNVQPLWRLGIKSIQQTMGLNGSNIMDHCMDLWNVEMFMDSLSNEQVFVFVEGFKRLLERFQGLRVCT